MPAIITSNFRTLNAKHFKEQISGSNVYVGIGKSAVWSLTTTDTTDTTSTDTTSTESESTTEIPVIKIATVNSDYVPDSK